jgi:Antibiotic biosynthesis monooxygenase
MPAFNVVRFRVRPGYEQRFVDAHREMQPKFKGFLGGNLIKTGDQTFCLVGEWRNLNSLVAARPEMIALLDVMREMLEDLGGGLGLTDPVSGETVVRLGAPKAKKKKVKAKDAKKKKGKKKDEKKRKKKKKSGK